MSLEGKTILVTGASSGIGRAIAIECSKLGAKVICTARNEQRLAETLSMMEGEGHLSIPAELTNREDVDSIVSRLPKLDGVSHNAGICRDMLCAFAKEDGIRRILEHNLLMPILLQTALIKKKKTVKNASIVFMNSLAAFSHGYSNCFYGTSKSGLKAYAGYLAKELAVRGVRVNSIHPGMVNTPLIHDFAVCTDEMLQQDVKNYPLGRYGEPEDIAHLAAFLLSDAASWITGCSYVIDGGVSL